VTRRSRFGNVRQIGSGRYQARWMGDDGFHHKAPSTFDTRDEAQSWLDHVRVNQRDGKLVDERGGVVRFADYAAEWAATVVHLRQSTKVRDLGYLKRYLIPRFGTVPIGDIKAPAVREWIASLATDRGLAPSTVEKAKQILKKILAQAVTDGLIPANPCTDVKVPRDEVKEMQTITAAQIHDLANAIDPRYRELLLLACWSGMRIGELVGLTVGDIDVVRRRVVVTKIVTEVSGHLVFGPPKTPAGRRVVPIVPWLADELAAYLDGKHPDDIAFPAPKGGYLRLASWRTRFWRDATKAIGKPGLRIHDMRHSAVSLWVANGVDPAKVAKYAGHTSEITVFKRYAHVDPDANLDALDVVGRPRRAATVTRIR
jgi:integrase